MLKKLERKLTGPQIIYSHKKITIDLTRIHGVDLIPEVKKAISVIQNDLDNFPQIKEFVFGDSEKRN